MPPLIILYKMGGGRRVIWISGSLIWSKTLLVLIFNPCGEFRWNPEDPDIQIHSPHLLFGVPGIFSDLLRSFQMLKRDWDAESNGNLPHLFICSKIAALVPEFAVEDLPLCRTVALVPEFAAKDLPLDRIILWWWSWYCYYLLLYLLLLLLLYYYYYYYYYYHHHHHHHQYWPPVWYSG